MNILITESVDYSELALKIYKNIGKLCFGLDNKYVYEKDIRYHAIMFLREVVL